MRIIVCTKRDLAGTIVLNGLSRYEALPDAEVFVAVRGKKLRRYDPQEYSAILSDALPVRVHDADLRETVAGFALAGEGQGGTCCYAGG